MIVCIKEIPLEKYIPGMTYIHWSHTIKGQPQNMPALDKMLELGVRHLDYEKILNDKVCSLTIARASTSLPSLTPASQELSHFSTNSASFF